MKETMGTVGSTVGHVDALHVRSETGAEQRRRVLQRWYREQLKALIPPLLVKWQQLLGHGTWEY